ncbi:MAG TPA: hypothetical protein PK020_07560 [Ilumatobacteraceae bacterium]|nr:hypothetical protein [Ilumatobacteraceae bacterium]HRB03118.1 hypothetical protein [Ilumatobacteraceae bacterium]
MPFVSDAKTCRGTVWGGATAKGTQVTFCELNSALAPGPHRVGSTYGRVMTSGVGVGVGVDGRTLVDDDVLEDVSMVESAGIGEVAGAGAWVLVAAFWVLVQPAITAAMAAIPTAIERALT